MKTLTDKQVHEQSKKYDWSEYVITISGKARRVGLVFVRQYKDGPFEDVQFCTIENDKSPEEIGKLLEDNWSANKRPEEPNIKYMRHVNIPGLGGQHIMIRMAASSARGELFRCVRCGCIREGYPDLRARNPLKLPYALYAPTIKDRNSKEFRKSVDAWREFHQPCPGNTTTPANARWEE